MDDIINNKNFEEIKNIICEKIAKIIIFSEERDL